MFTWNFMLFPIFIVADCIMDRQQRVFGDGRWEVRRGDFAQGDPPSVHLCLHLCDHFGGGRRARMGKGAWPRKVHKLRIEKSFRKSPLCCSSAVFTEQFSSNVNWEKVSGMQNQRAHRPLCNFLPGAGTRMRKWFLEVYNLSNIQNPRWCTIWSRYRK